MDAKDAVRNNFSVAAIEDGDNSYNEEEWIFPLYSGSIYFETVMPTHVGSDRGGEFAEYLADQIVGLFRDTDLGYPNVIHVVLNRTGDNAVQHATCRECWPA